MMVHVFEDPTPSSEDVQWYSNAWRRILRHILAWSDQRIDDWLTSMSHVLHNPYLTHDHTSWYVAPLFISPSLRQKLGPHFNRFCADIVHAIEGNDFSLVDPNYDWAAAARRIESLLAPYDEHIPKEETL